MFNKSTRSYLFRELVEEARSRHRVSWGPHVLTWREARLMFKGATVAAIYYVQHQH